MQMTLSQYILNPMGKNNAVLNATAREAIRNSYIKKYDAILVREHGVIKYSLYRDEKKNRYFAHFKIPSETITKFYYDVVLEFYADNTIKPGASLFDYYVRFYSNDPAFVYTYTNVFFNNDLFINELKSKMSKKAIKKSPDEKNPSKLVGYVKTIYFAYLTMKNKSLDNVERFKALSDKLVMRSLIDNIIDADIKIGDREAEGAKLNKTKKAERKKKEENNTNTNNVFYIKGINKTKTVSRVNNKNNMVKTVKKIK